MKKILNITSLLFLASCAQIVMPGGGLKDAVPPAALSYSPDSASVNFNAQLVEIVFDEYLVLSGLDKQLVISPPMKQRPDIYVKEKTLYIDFTEADSLKPNTTYAFSFGNALKDLNEGNVKEDFRYLFSTGTFIDSLTVKGEIKNAFDHKTEKGVLISLYSDISDSVVFKLLPDYFAKTREDGTFQINNIREGKYKVVALKDENSNYLYDSGKERVGFLTDTIDATTYPTIEMDLFQEPVQKLYIKKRVHNSYGKILFVLNKPTDSIRVTPLNHTFKNEDVILNFSKHKDSLTYWFKETEKDSLILQVNNGSIILDTLEFKLITKEKSLKDKKNPLALKLLSSPNGNQRFDLKSELKLVFNNPIDSIDREFKIELLEDSVQYSSKEPLLFKSSSDKKNKIQISHWINGDTIEDLENPGVMYFGYELVPTLKLKANTSYHLFIPPGTFTDIFGLKNDSITIDFKTRKEKYYGTVALTINLSDSSKVTNDSVNYIIQLLDSKEKVIREEAFKMGEALKFNYLHPQKYLLKIIVDENINGQWDTGNYLEGKQPEKVIYYTEPITIRSNWDLDIEWNYSE